MKTKKRIPLFVYLCGIVILLLALVGIYQFQQSLTKDQAAKAKTEKVYKLNQDQSVNYTLFSSEEKALAKSMKITIIGDSITKGAQPLYQELFKHNSFSAEVSRPVEAAPEIIQDFADNDQLYDVVLIALGTNGPVEADDVAQIMELVGNRQVYWVNVHVPTRDWESEVNDELTQAATQYSNLKIIDWHNYSAENPEWYSDDDIHPTEAGSKELVTYVAKDILSNELTKAK